MADETKISIDDFRRTLEELINKIVVKELVVDKKSMETFCEVTGHDFSSYIENSLIPQGYLMTLTIPMFVQFFMMVGKDLLPQAIKGVIHTNSKIEYYRPLTMGRKYFGKMSVKDMVEKSGKMGDYFAVDFEVLINDEKGKKMASDIHQFFLRV